MIATPSWWRIYPAHYLGPFCALCIAYLAQLRCIDLFAGHSSTACRHAHSRISGEVDFVFSIAPPSDLTKHAICERIVAGLEFNRVTVQVLAGDENI